MTAKEALDQIRALFNQEQPAESTPAPAAEFVEAKTMDGKVIKAENWNVGTPVTVVTEEGELPMPDGEHELEGGKILITAGGLVVEVKEVEAEAPMADNTAMAAEVESLKAENAELKSNLKELSDKFNAHVESVAKSTTTSNEAFAKMLDLIEKFGELPIKQKEEEKVNEKFKKAEHKANLLNKFADIKKTIKN